MNRKLHNSILAFSATGLMLVMGLMAASPVRPLQDDAFSTVRQLPTASMASMNADVQARLDGAEARARSIEARAAQLQADLDRSASLGDTIASAVTFAAAVSTEAALSAALDASDTAAEKQRAADTEQRLHARKVRSALAVPYFSFAQGLRRNSRS
jgi:hypothetical protein